jgi:hypothetical protein
LFKTHKTSDIAISSQSKVLLYAEAGWGKTTQAAHYKASYGKGLILSMESGLRSLKDVDVEFVNITSWDGAHDPDQGLYSFKGVCGAISTREFRTSGYKWIMVDSLTELSDLLMAEVEERHKGSKNGFEKWAEYARLLIGACKWLRDQPFTVIITALLKESTDENGGITYGPLIQGNAVGSKLAGLYDFVFAGVRVSGNDKTAAKSIRYIVTDEVRGYVAKSRDPKRRLKAVERCDAIPLLIERIDMSDGDYDSYTKAMAAAAAAQTEKTEA